MKRYLMRLCLGTVLLLPFGLAAGESYTLIEDRVYASPEGEDQLVDLYIPGGEGPHPAVLLIHGGGWKSGEPADMEGFADRLVEAGYAVANISYRLAPEHRWPAQIEDCRTALRWLREQAEGLHIDPKRIGAFGYSAGAHLAMALGTDSPKNPQERVQAVVAGSGPYDLRVYPESPYIYKLIGGGPQEYPDEYADASPLTKASPDDAPAFLYHGKRDRLVEVEQSYNMAAALADAGVPVVMREEPFGHALTFVFDRGSFAEALEFLDKYLR